MTRCGILFALLLPAVSLSNADPHEDMHYRLSYAHAELKHLYGAELGLRLND